MKRTMKRMMRMKRMMKRMMRMRKTTRRRRQVLKQVTKRKSRTPRRVSNSRESSECGFWARCGLPFALVSQILSVHPLSSKGGFIQDNLYRYK